MITYEASLICDTCKAAIAGAPATHFMRARSSAVAEGRKRGWTVNPPSLGYGTEVTCNVCLEKAKNPCNSNRPS